jgi:hypothetical protein
MKYNFHALKKQDDLTWAVIHAVSELTESEFKEMDPKNIDIELKVEGKEIDFLKFMSHYFSQMDRLVAEKAKEILKRRLGEAGNMLYEIEECLKEKLVRLEGEQ